MSFLLLLEYGLYLIGLMSSGLNQDNSGWNPVLMLDQCNDLPPKMTHLTVNRLQNTDVYIYTCCIYNFTLLSQKCLTSKVFCPGHPPVTKTVDVTSFSR